MSKRHASCCLFFLLLLSILIPQSLVAEDLVGLKNLSWEEQKNKTRIILETSRPLNYNVIASQSSSEVQVVLANLDLRNLPQELFINTNEVISLQTFPQTEGQKARLIVKLTSFRPHQVLAEGNKLYIDIEGNPEGDALLAPVTSVLPPQEQQQQTPATQEAPVSKPVEPAVAPAEQTAQAAEPASVQDAVQEPSPVQEQLGAATEIRDLKIQPLPGDGVDVVLVANGTLRYDIFELSNPQRLVIDLQSVTMAPHVQNMTAGGQNMVSKVRIAQYQVAPKVVRAVLDLNRKVPYRVVPSGAELRIHLGDSESSNGSAHETPAQEPEPVAAEASQAVPPAPTESLPKTLASEPAPSVAKADIATPAFDNEQFFAFKPDTSLFAQSNPPAPAPQTETTGHGVGTFQEKTLRGGQKQYTGEPFSFDFKDIDIKDLFRFIADISGLNVILDPTVRGSVTLKLTEVPWDQALDLITKNQGLGYTVEGNVIRIAPLSKIAQEEKARVDAEKQQMLSAPLVTKIKPLSYAKAADADRIIKKLLTPKGSSIIDARTNTLIITDIDTNIDAIINLVDTLDSRTSQVLIEARIVETTKNYSQAFGIQWGFRGIVDPAFGNNTTLQFPNNVLADGSVINSTTGISGNPLGGYAVNLPTNNAPNSAILLSAGNILDTFRLDIALMALENTGNGRVLSSPKVATQNNTRAEIIQGTQIPVQTIANNTVTTTFIQASLRLSVIPQITAEGTVIMDVEVENNKPNLSIVTLGGTPAIDTERAQTTLRVEDGGTTVIGGIFTASDQYAQARTPVLHRIPLLGWLFKNTNVTRENRELLIFLTPRILR